MKKYHFCYSGVCYRLPDADLPGIVVLRCTTCLLLLRLVVTLVPAFYVRSITRCSTTWAGVLDAVAVDLFISRLLYKLTLIIGVFCTGGSSASACLIFPYPYPDDLRYYDGDLELFPCFDIDLTYVVYFDYWALRFNAYVCAPICWIFSNVYVLWLRAVATTVTAGSESLESESSSTGICDYFLICYDSDVYLRYFLSSSVTFGTVDISFAFTYGIYIFSILS